jgi:cobyrinic acid a,c-diamide synthase
MRLKGRSIVIAGTHSGCGKTTVAIGIIAALTRRGLSLQPFKVGPDFIDPGYHQMASGVPSRNLDGWMLSRRYTVETFVRLSRGKDVALIEGVMGLYDGYGGKGEKGSTAQIAKWLTSPVVLVVDARSMARSAAALVYGFEKFDRKVTIAAVIFNRVGSEKHYHYLKEAIEGRCRAKVIGYLPKDTSLTIPERHLGLITAQEHTLDDEYLKRIASLTERFIDIPQLLRLGSPLTRVKLTATHHARQGSEKVRVVKIGIAHDEAFCFYYPDNLELLQQQGAELIFFSPMRDTSLPQGVDGIYLGGGYPELYARDLAINKVMKREIKEFALSGGIVYAECGGLMYLGKALKDFNNKLYEMAGVFPFTTKMGKRLTTLGYYTVKAMNDTIISRKGAVIRGHQFRYSTLEEVPAFLKRVYHLRKGDHGKVEKEGFSFKNVLASYAHLHFGSNSNCARHFIESCRTKKISNSKS